MQQGIPPAISLPQPHPSCKRACLCCCAGATPSPRSGAELAIGCGHYAFLFGGRNNFVLDDLHVLDLITHTWLQITQRGAAPPPRHGHALCVHDEELFCFGGLNELGAPTTSLFHARIVRGMLEAAGAAAAAAATPPASTAAVVNIRAAAPGGGASSSNNSTSNSSSIPLEWDELDAQLPFCSSRTAVMAGGQLRCYQLSGSGATTSADEDLEKGVFAVQQSSTNWTCNL